MHLSRIKEENPVEEAISAIVRSSNGIVFSVIGLCGLLKSCSKTKTLEFCSLKTLVIFSYVFFFLLKCFVKRTMATLASCEWAL